MMFCVELTNHCNMKCNMCPHQKMIREKGFMEFDLFKHIIKESKDNDWPITWLHHFGEPLLHPELEKFLKYFNEHGYGDGAISTNGMALDEEHKATLLKYAKCVRLSLDTFNPEIYKQLRGDYHKQVLNNITAFVKESKGKSLKVEVQLLKSKFEPEPDTNVFCKDCLFIKDMTYFPDTEDYRDKQFPWPGCGNDLIILWNGDVTCCCADYNGELVLGNLMDYSLKELWEKHKELNRDNPLCNRCVYSRCNE